MIVKLYTASTVLFLLVVLADTVISSTTNLAVASANVVEQDTLVTFVRAVLQSVLAVVLRQELFSPHFKDIFPLVEAPKVTIYSADTPEIQANAHVNNATITTYFAINFFIIFFPPFL